MNALSILVLFAALQEPAAPAPSRDEVIQQDIEEAIKRLGSDRRTESYEARVELEELGRRAVPAVVAELGKKETPPAVKRALCEILGRVRDPRKDAVAALVAKLKDTDEFGTTIASAAARALGSIGDEAAAAALIESLDSKAVEIDRLLKVECIRALGVMRAKEAAGSLRKALEDKRAAMIGEGDERAPTIAAAAADAIGLIRAPEAVEDLGKMLSETQVNAATDLSLGIHAARALRRIFGPELRGKTEKEDARAAAFTGDPEADGKLLEAWKKWWDERKGQKDVAATRERVAEVAAAVEAFKKVQGRYPDVLAHLQKAPTDAKDFPKEGYYKGDLKDAWGRPFIYRHPGTGSDFDVLSQGKDGAPWGGGLDADLWSHDKWIEAKKAETRKAIQEAVEAIGKFKADNERLPEKIGDLVTKPTGYLIKKWPEKGYLAAPPKDGFGKYLEYQMPGTGGEPFDLISRGADGSEGGTGADEDLWNHDKRPPKKEEPKKDDPKDEKK